MHAPHASIAPPTPALAQASIGSAALWIALLLLAVIAGAVALFFIRKQLLGEDPATESGGLTLQDLREMHQRGDITAEELEALKKIVPGAASSPTPGRNPLTGLERKPPSLHQKKQTPPQ